MKSFFNKIVQVIFVLFIFLLNTPIFGQAFRKGTLLVSISEGGIIGNFNTSNEGNSRQPNKLRTAERDPLFFEYGITNHLGIGITAGADIWNVNSSDYYNFDTPNETIKLKTSEFTVDLTYHFFVKNRIDWSVYGSVGGFTTAFNQKNEGSNKDYFAEGVIIRTGTNFRYYFTKRWAVLGILSYFNSQASPKDQAKNNLRTDYTTSISGFASELGLSYLIRKGR